MQNKALIISGIALGAIAVAVFLYIPILTHNYSASPEPGPSSQESFESLNFQLSSNATPGNTDDYDSDSFTIYLERGHELYLSFYAEGAPVMFRATTPSDNVLGYLTSTGNAGNIEDKGMGKLEKGKVLSTREGHFEFFAPEEGSYIFTVKSAAPQGDINVVVEYRIN